MSMNIENPGVLVHSSEVLDTPLGLFVADTHVWELDGASLATRITIPSSGDNAYPGLIMDLNSDLKAPAFFISWYSNLQETNNNAAVYMGRLSATAAR
jgi:hypothetical protein